MYVICLVLTIVLQQQCAKLDIFNNSDEHSITYLPSDIHLLCNKEMGVESLSFATLSSRNSVEQAGAVFFFPKMGWACCDAMYL